MSTINVQNLLVQINRKLETAKNNKEILMLSRAVSVLQTGVVFTVGTFANLPDPTSNVGKLYFVEADALLYFSFITDYGSVSQWIPITQISVNTLWSWGCQPAGRLGDGTTLNRCSPGTVAGGGTTWCQISSSTTSTSAIKTDGTLWTWGCNNLGQLGNGTTVSRSSPGTVAGGGTNWCSSCMAVCLASAIKTDGTLWTWGTNLYGVLGDGTTVSRSSPGTVAGGGTTWCQVSQNGISSQSAVAAIKTDGTLWTWGCNRGGSLGDGTTVNKCSPGTVAGGGTTWCQVSLSSFILFAAAIKTDGTLWTWGQNDKGQLGDGTTVSRCSPGTVAGGGTTWCLVGYGKAIKTDGTLWVWGCNRGGALGDGTTVNKCSPGTIAGGGTTWCFVSENSYNSTSLKTDGTLWTWGCNENGQLGDGTAVDRCSPGTVAGGTNVWWKLSNTIAITKETL